ncbi:hypothetical protein LTR95_001922 [Oleoguttula sp. CCFEE 5521]
MGLHILAFKEWATHDGVTVSGTIDQLRDKRVAIDAEDWLNTLLTAQTTREPLLPALGGLPFALKKHVNEHLEGFRSAGITPTFVFNGLDLACRDRAAIAKESRIAAASLDEAWRLYGESKADDAVAEFGKSCTYGTYHILRWLRSYLHTEGVRIQIAPTAAAAQVVALYNENFADAVVGSMSCLLYGASKVILSLDWETKFFVWADKPKCLTKLHLNDDQFIDLCLLSGLTILAPPPIPEIELNPAPLIAARELLARCNNDGLLACDSLKNDAYKLLFQKARAAITHPVWIDNTGTTCTKHGKMIPNDLHDVTGQRLPDEIYYYLSRGVVCPRILDWRTRMEVFEVVPLDGGSSRPYQTLVSEKLAPLRTRSMALVSGNLQKYWQKKDVELVCWYEIDRKKALDVPDAFPLSQAADRWHVKEDLIARSAAAAGLEMQRSPLYAAVAVLSHNGIPERTITELLPNTVKPSDGPLPVTGTYTTRQELLGNATFRFLEDRGYINNDHTLSAWGKALKVALDHAKSTEYLDIGDDSREAEEAIFMAFELHRLEALNSLNLFPATSYQGAPMRGSDIDKANTLLLSRIACLGSFQHGEIGFTGPLSRHLLAYHQMAAATRGALRDLLEVHALSMMLKGAASRDLTPLDYSSLGSDLPLLREPDLGLSLVVKSYLDELSNEKRTDITKWFNHATDIKGDLKKAWKMWGAINAGIQAADSGIVNNDTKTTFRKADEWLALKLKQAGTEANGT